MAGLCPNIPYFPIVFGIFNKVIGLSLIHISSLNRPPQRVSPSNTHGYCGAQEGETLCGGRFSEAERWPCLLQRALGEDWLLYTADVGVRLRHEVFGSGLNVSSGGQDLSEHGPPQGALLGPAAGQVVVCLCLLYTSRCV